MDSLGNFFIIGLSSAFLFLILFQVRKLWKIKNTLDTFLSDLKSLNKSTRKITNFSNNRCINTRISESIEQRICENCRYRVTYLDYTFENLFYYKCKLDNKDVALNHTCKNYQKDLQNYKI